MSGTGNKLNILWLWPDILCQHGDRGNVMALARVSGLYGIETEITRVSRLNDDFDLEGADIVMLGPGELVVMPEISSALARRSDELKAYVESGGVLFAAGTTGAALGVRTRRLDGTLINGAGLLGIECRERETVLGDDLIFLPAKNPLPGKAETADTAAAVLPVYGIQIHMMDIDLAAGQEPFGHTVYGYGNNGSGAEGAVSGGVIFTNALGPVLVKNPWLTIDVINLALYRQREAAGGEMIQFDPGLFELELASAEAIKLFNEKKEKPK